MNNVIKIQLEDINYLVTECVKRILSENNIQQQNPNMPQQQIPYSDRMARVVNGSSLPKEAEQYIGTLNNFYGRIAKTAQENNVAYLDVLKNLQEKITYYLSAGYFGKSQIVTDTVKKFTELISFLYGLYKKEVKKQWAKRGLNEGLFDWYRNWRTDDENEFGVQQKPQDNSGNQYALQQKDGQWMVDLQQELNQLLKWSFLFGPTTIEVTKQFIQFLNVRRKTIMGMIFGTNGKAFMTKTLKSMRNGLIGVAALAGILGGISSDSTSSMNDVGSAPNNGIEMMAQQQQEISVNFEINSAELSPEDIQKLQQMSDYDGDITIIVHQSQNPSGKDASYEGQLVQQRGQAVMKALGKQANVQRGDNGIKPYVEVIFN